MVRRRKAVEKTGSRRGQVSQGLRRSYEFKIKVISEAASSYNCQAAKKYGVTECNVGRWRAQKDGLKHANRG
ncbi:pogo transposable element with KRAB domain [Lates japonicus]|uniref:Pogo transposable element with KRAB domain n=1 Tax=Lates japonicus TaxID=270547 RepID=A0AAD3MGH1_LATJO|nr:pogo transposable element with KRAB domain [Lates japonicus]